MTQSARPDPDHQGTAPWQRVAWPTAVVLGLLGLARPVAAVVARAAHTDLGLAAVWITVAVSVVWVVVVAARRSTPAIPTLVAAGLVQAASAAVLALGTTWVFDGKPAGPLVRPVELAVLLGAGALWGLVCGAAALTLRRARERWHRH
ncbi:hypothetical protein [Xylanimonas sp. McL0601]|uniref:hypothetical protein n=1 Tax=Xylanimonas sp. McL0601 TaxID=3414739 RepID=UPI003CF92EE6